MNNKMIFTMLVSVIFFSSIWLGYSSLSQSSSASQQQLNNLKAELHELKLMLALNDRGEIA